MTLNIPSFRQYFIGFVLISALAVTVHFLVSESFLLEVGAFWALMIGLFFGHIIGTVLSGDSENIDDAEYDESEVQTLYVGNIAFNASQKELKHLFGQHGSVHSIRLMTDRITRKPRGYGFVEVDAIDADGVINALDGHKLLGRTLRVSQANDRPPRTPQR
jgi:hypothetical protein